MYIKLSLCDSNRIEARSEDCRGRDYIALGVTGEIEKRQWSGY